MYGVSLTFSGNVQRTPPIEYHAGTRATPVTERPLAASVAAVLSTAGWTVDGCRLWNCPMSPNTERRGVRCTPTSPIMSPEVPSGLTANPPATFAYTFELCANDGTAASASIAGINRIFIGPPQRRV